MARCGIASRRKCDEYITQGRVSVNGEVVTGLGTQIDEESDEVEFDGVRVALNSSRNYFLLNKPKGYLSAVSDDRGRKTVTALIDGEKGLHPVGRLDLDTTGVLLITDDGDFTYKMTHPKHGLQKSYTATLDRDVTPGDIEKIRSGFDLEDGPVLPTDVEQKERNVVSVSLVEGRNRIVRRIFKHLGYQVIDLHRDSFVGLTIKGLAPGQWRRLSDEEVDKLRG